MDKEVLLRPETFEDYISLILFWVLAFVVFLQFFTRYVLNSSLGWTEEIARILLIATSLLGSALAVRKNSHITVEFFYRYLSPRGGRIMSTVVDLLRIVFFGVLTFTCYRLADRTFGALVSIDFPKKNALPHFQRHVRRQPAPLHHGGVSTFAGGRQLSESDRSTKNRSGLQTIHHRLDRAGPDRHHCRRGSVRPVLRSTNRFPFRLCLPDYRHRPARGLLSGAGPLTCMSSCRVWPRTWSSPTA